MYDLPNSPFGGRAVLEPTENLQLVVSNQPQGVSLRLATHPEANALRLICPNHRSDKPHDLFGRVARYTSGDGPTLVPSGIPSLPCSPQLIATWIGFALILTGCDSARPQVESLSRSDLFRLHCSSCHGDGSGNGHIAATLPVRPRNLRHADWQDSVDDERILNVIRFGGLQYKLSDRMPGFADKLTEPQIQSLMQYIRSFRVQ